MYVCMNTMFYFDYWGHQELKNIALARLWKLTPPTYTACALHALVTLLALPKPLTLTLCMNRTDSRDDTVSLIAMIKLSPVFLLPHY